jgi:FkbM family methyltransferase
MPVVRKVLIGFWNTYVRTFKPRFSVEQRMGLTLLLDRESNLDRALLVRGTWEHRQLAALTKLILQHRSPGQRSLFLDVGAHAALYSIIVAKQNLCAEVYAFEPDPVSRAQLQANLMLNGVLDEVQVVPAAVSNQAGTVTFHRAEDLRRGESRLDLGGDDQPDIANSFSVEAVRLDARFDLQEAFVALKIDIEGHELQALEGMVRLLTQNHCVLQVESFEENAAGVMAFMEEHGYRLAERIRHDYFFVPAGR